MNSSIIVGIYLSVNHFLVKTYQFNGFNMKKAAFHDRKVGIFESTTRN